MPLDPTGVLPSPGPPYIPGPHWGTSVPRPLRLPFPHSKYTTVISICCISCGYVPSVLNFTVESNISVQWFRVVVEIKLTL